MNVILLGAAKPKAKCKCCGAPALTNVIFDGPDADKEAGIGLCGSCGRLLGRMLLEETTGRLTHPRWNGAGSCA